MLTMFNKEHPEQGVLYILIANLISAVVKPVLLYKYFLQLRYGDAHHAFDLQIEISWVDDACTSSLRASWNKTIRRDY